MATRQSTNKSQTRTGVKKKSTVTNVVQEEDTFAKASHELTKGLTDQEVEIEHLKTTIIALNEKAEVLTTNLPILELE